MMLISNAEVATEQARRIIGNPPRFLFKPREGKQVGNHWVIKATTTGIFDDILVTVDMPEKLLDV